MIKWPWLGSSVSLPVEYLPFFSHSKNDLERSSSFWMSNVLVLRSTPVSGIQSFSTLTLFRNRTTGRDLRYENWLTDPRSHELFSLISWQGLYSTMLAPSSEHHLFFLHHSVVLFDIRYLWPLKRTFIQCSAHTYELNSRWFTIERKWTFTMLEIRRIAILVQDWLLPRRNRSR